MNKKWWTGIAIFLLILAFMFTGGIAYESGHNHGWDEGYATHTVEVEMETRGLEEAGYLAPPELYWRGEPEEPDWERILANILEEIDSANITIHIEDTEGRKSDIHISWNK